MSDVAIEKKTKPARCVPETQAERTNVPARKKLHIEADHHARAHHDGVASANEAAIDSITQQFLVGLQPVRSDGIALDRAYFIEQQKLGAQWDAFIQEFRSDLKATAFHHLGATEVQLQEIVAQHVDPKRPNPAIEDLRAGLRADRALAEREAKLLGELARLRPNGKFTRDDALDFSMWPAEFEEGTDALRLIRAERVALRVSNPALGLFPPGSVNEDTSDLQLRDAVTAGAARFQNGVRHVRQKIESGEIALEKLDLLVERTLDDEGLSADSAKHGDFRSEAVLQWLELSRSMTNADKATMTTALLLGIGAAAATGGVSVALGLAGACLGIGAGINDLRVAEDLMNAAEATLSEEHALADKSGAGAQVVFAQVNLVLAAADLAIAGKAAATTLRASTFLRRLTKVGGPDVLAQLKPHHVIHFERVATASKAEADSILNGLREELGARVFEGARAFFEARTQIRQTLNLQVTPKVFDEMYAAVGSDGLRRLASICDGPTISQLHAKLGPVQIRRFAERHGEEAVVKLATSLNTSEASEVFRAFRDLGTGLKALIEKVAPKALTEIAQAIGPAQLRRKLRQLGPDGFAHLVHSLGQDGAVSLLLGKLNPAALDRLRRQLADPSVRTALASVRGRDVAVLLVHEIEPKEIARLIENARLLSPGLEKETVQYLSQLTSRSAIKREMHYAEEAIKHELRDGGHALTRHGPQLSLGEIEWRTISGVAPDLKTSATQFSAKFESFEAFIKTRERALETFAQMEGIDLTKPPPSSWNKKMTKARKKALAESPPSATFEVQVGKPLTIDHLDGFMGSGYAGKGPHPDGTFMRTKKLDGLYRTKSNLNWVGESSDPTYTKGHWSLTQHFPVAEAFDPKVKAYTVGANRTVP